MRCLVTGVAGFVGSHLAERLLEDGHEVCGIDLFVDYYPRQIKEYNLERLCKESRFELIEGNLLALPLLSLLKDVDWVFHQAAQAGVHSSWGNEFARYTECNVLATQRLLEAVTRCGSLKRFVYASSSSVYGDAPALPVSEAERPRPVSPYGVTKLAAEHLCMLYCHNFGVPAVALRYFTVYGPRQRPDMAFYRFCKALLNRLPVQIYGDGRQTRDFTYISDVVEANILAATVPAAIGEVFNIAGGARVTLREALDLLGKINGSPVPAVFVKERHGDVRDTFADTTHAARVLGYAPRVSLREGLEKQLQHIKAYAQSLTAPSGLAPSVTRGMQ